MKLFFVEGRYKGQLNLDPLKEQDFPEKIGLFTTVQFVDCIDEIKSILEKKGKKVFLGKKNQIYPGQIIGCDTGGPEKVDDDVDAYLYVGTGMFHPIAVSQKFEKEIFCFDPISGKLTKLPKGYSDKFRKRRNAAYLKFLSSKEIGILVSLKPGQNNIRKSIEFKKNNKDKNCYIFIFDTLNFMEIENFPFIECWVNTACPRIQDDNEKFPKPLADIDYINKMQKGA